MFVFFFFLLLCPSTACTVSVKLYNDKPTAQKWKQNAQLDMWSFGLASLLHAAVTEEDRCCLYLFIYDDDDDTDGGNDDFNFPAIQPEDIHHGARIFCPTLQACHTKSIEFNACSDCCE